MIGAVSWFSSQVALSQEDPSSGFESSAPASDEAVGGDTEASADTDMFGTEAEVASADTGDSASASSDQATDDAKAKPAKKSKAKRHRLAKKKSRKHAKKAVVAEESANESKATEEKASPELKQATKSPVVETAETKTPEAKSVESKPAETIAAATPTSPATAPTPGASIGDGSPITIESLGVTITPPKGWEVQTQNGSLSVVMREPAVANAVPGQTKFQRNITVAAIHKPAPIDEKRAEELKAELVRNFGGDASLSDFKVGEHKFFNFHGNNDGLLVYSTMTVREFPMMQMHILVSGEDKQFLLTYTDLASQFGSEKDPAYAAAWESMVSVQVKGQAPTRFELYKNHMIAGGTGVFLLLVGWILRRRAANIDFKGEADALIDSEDSLTFDASKAPKTVVSQVSAAAAPMSAVPATNTSNFSFISSF